MKRTGDLCWVDAQQFIADAFKRKYVQLAPHIQRM